MPRTAPDWRTETRGTGSRSRRNASITPSMITPESPARMQTLTRLRLLVATPHAAPVAGDSERELPPLSRGQAIDGRVEQRVRDAYIVSVRERRFEIKLPAEARPGDTLRLVFVSESPRPTFALLNIEPAASARGSGISETGKLLAMLRNFPPGDAAALGVAAAPDADAAVPVFPARVAQAEQAALLLRQTLAVSGLFYESHQAQWVLGTRSTAQLKLEPQGRIVPTPASAAHAPMELQACAIPETSLPDRRPDSAEVDAPAPAPSERSPVHPDTFPIVRQQLSALESGQLVWRGFIWPGQAMEWTLEEEPEREHADDRAPEQHGVASSWRTGIRITLPNLGEVVATLELDGAGAQLRLLADSGHHAGQLRERTPELAAGFAARGIALHALEVGHGTATA